MTNPDYTPLIKIAHEQWQRDPKDTQLINFIVGSLIIDVLAEEGITGE